MFFKQAAVAALDELNISISRYLPCCLALISNVTYTDVSCQCLSVVFVMPVTQPHLFLRFHEYKPDHLLLLYSPTTHTSFSPPFFSISFFPLVVSRAWQLQRIFCPPTQDVMP